MEAEHILGMRVDAVSYDGALRRILSWARIGGHRYVCAANVHMAMTSVDDPGFRDVVNAADMVVADGMPLVWMLRLMGLGYATRVRGPTLMLLTCEEAAKRGIPVGFFGGTRELVDGATLALHQKLPGLEIAYAHAPPFRALTSEEDATVVREICESGTGVLFVGLGCPKQERWMAAHRDQLPVVQIGVGAAFAFAAGSIREAPRILQNAGLEWTFRLAVEPRRLWKRYLLTNPRFLALAMLQLLRQRRG